MVVTRDCPGFTLIELLLSLSLLGMVAATILGIFQFHVLNWERHQQLVDVQDNLRIALDRLARETRQAKDLHSGTSSNNLMFYNSENRLIEYSLEGTTLYRKSGTSVKQPVADNILRLEVNYGSRGLVTISVSGKAKDTAEICYTTAVSIRTVGFD